MELIILIIESKELYFQTGEQAKIDIDIEPRLERI
jgi:hypothetical protein